MCRGDTINIIHYIARSKMQNAENAREPLRPRTSPSSFMKHSSGEGASICSSQRGLVGVAQHRNAVCLFALRTWQSRRASGCSVTPESPVVQGSACGRLHCANTSGSTNCRQSYVGNKARLAGQPGSEPRSPASWPKVGLKPLAVADPPPSAKPCCSPAFNYKKGPRPPVTQASIGRTTYSQPPAAWSARPAALPRRIRREPVWCPAFWRMLS